MRIPCILYCTRHICFSHFYSKGAVLARFGIITIYVHMTWHQKLLNHNDNRNNLKFSILEFRKKFAIHVFHFQVADRQAQVFRSNIRADSFLPWLVVKTTPVWVSDSWGQMSNNPFIIFQFFFFFVILFLFKTTYSWFIPSELIFINFHIWQCPDFILLQLALVNSHFYGQ